MIGEQTRSHMEDSAFRFGAPAPEAGPAIPPSRDDETEHYRSLAEVIPHIVWSARPGGEVEYHNTRWRDYTGLTADEGAAWGWLDVVHPDDRARCLDRWGRALRTGKSCEAEYRLRRADGAYRWHLGRASPMRDGHGRIVRWFGTFTDIDDRKRAEEAWRAGKARLRLALEAGQLGNWELDLTTGTVIRSPFYDRVFGYEEPRPEWSYEIFLRHVLPEDRDDVDRAFHEAIETRHEWRRECRIRRPDGAVRWIEAFGQMLPEPSGRASRMHGLVQDITERKRAEERQEVLLREMNHRVKNTLATVRAIANLTLRDGASIAQRRTAFNDRLAALAGAHDLLTRGDWRTAGLREIVRSVLAPYADQAIRRLDVDGEDVPVGVDMAVALAMAIHELATNAAKYGALSVPAGRVNIGWRVLNGSGDPRLRLRWIESGGPKVAEPSRRGFGSTLVEHALPRQLGGTARLEFEPGGVRFAMDAPLRVEAG